jgi:biopolymer transport protein ExbB/TolQ
MIEAFRSGGVMMWPMLVIALGIAWIGVRTALRARENPSGDDVRRGMQSLLFWGGMAALLGLLGTAVGLVITAQAVARVPDAGASLIWGGIGVTLTTLIFGLMIFLLAALAWFVLGMWSSRLARAT